MCGRTWRSASPIRMLSAFIIISASLSVINRAPFGINNLTYFVQSQARVSHIRPLQRNVEKLEHGIAFASRSCVPSVARQPMTVRTTLSPLPFAFTHTQSLTPVSTTAVTNGANHWRTLPLRTCPDYKNVTGFGEGGISLHYSSVGMVKHTRGAVLELVPVASLTLHPSARNLMIVAHADDETIFGCQALIDSPANSWVVVVVNKAGVARDAVLPNVTQFYSLAALVALEHLDRLYVEWYNAHMVDSLEAILRMRTWDTVITHSARGEYGHTQHKALYTVVTGLLQLPGVHYRALRVFDFNPGERNHSLQRNMTDIVGPALRLYGTKIVEQFAWIIARSRYPVLETSNTTTNALAEVVCVTSQSPSASPDGEPIHKPVASTQPSSEMPFFNVLRRRRIISINVFYMRTTPNSLNLHAMPNLTTMLSEAASDASSSDKTIYFNDYFRPLINVILNWQYLLPDWTVRVYINKGHPFVAQLRRVHAEVIEMEGFSPALWSAATAWRFLVEDDTSVDAWASRESESAPTYQDAALIVHWMRTGLPIHNIALHRGHQTINAGTWGARGGYLTRILNTTMADAIQAYAASQNAKGRPFGSNYGDDQNFQSHVIFRALRHSPTKSNRLVDGVFYIAPSIPQKDCFYMYCLPFPQYPDEAPFPILRASMNRNARGGLILCHYTEAPHCRKHTTLPVDADLRLYALCTGSDFYSGKRVRGSEVQLLGFTTCPYANVTSAPIWHANGY